ncbi:hypothetical protein WN944_027143 [Citrus x changshan-huyou]|uniref:Uncharacterized protein n=1 Tax=Citrus x changshan-huyou TaxID=2935761 RepID=A0AAP0LJF7_9ROSI
MTFSRASLTISLSVTESLSLLSPPCALLPPVSIAFHLLHPSSCYQQKLFALVPTDGAKNVDAGFRFFSFYDQDLCSINFVTTRRSPRKTFSPEVPAHTDKSEYAGCFPGANPPTLKSDIKASSESQFSALFETVWDSDCCVMGKRGILRVTPPFWGKRGCRGSVRSCVLRHGSGESVAVVEIGLADDVLVDEQDISAPVPPRTRLFRDTPVHRTLPSDICSPCLDAISLQQMYMRGAVFLQNVWMLAPKENFLTLVYNTSATGNSTLMQMLAELKAAKE